MTALWNSGNSSLEFETERKHEHDRVVDCDKRIRVNRRRRCHQHSFRKHTNLSSLVICAIISIALSFHWDHWDGAVIGPKSSFLEVDAFDPNRILSRGSSNLRSKPFCRKAPTTILLALEGPAKTEQQQKASSTTRYEIRDCEYRQLSTVADIVVDSFYDNKKVNGVAKKLYKLAELNRLQQNFPYPESRTVHKMLVVMADEHPGEPSSDQPTVVGFCDIDARPCATKLKLPRPYLSDLAIHPNHRRRGLARMLVEYAEDFVLGISSSDSDKAPFDELWIRVASKNEAALGLYKDKLSYSFAEWTTGEEVKTTNTGEPEIWTLRKDLR